MTFTGHNARYTEHLHHLQNYQHPVPAVYLSNNSATTIPKAAPAKTSTGV